METCLKRSFETANAPVRLRWTGGASDEMVPLSLSAVNSHILGCEVAHETDLSC